MEPFTQEQQVNNYNLATIFERAIAFVMDLMICLVVLTVIYKIVGTPSITIYLIFVILFFVLYTTILTTGKLQTIGKFLLGIKVIDRKTKQNLTFSKAFLRAIGYVINLFTAFIGFSFVLFSKKRLALEDLLAGSEVVSVRQKTSSEMTLITVLGTALIFGAVYLVYSNVVFDPYKAMKVSAENQLKKIAQLEELHKKHYGVYTTDLLRLALISGDAVQFQRDMQQYFRPHRFKIGVSENGYYIEGLAKDNVDPDKSSMVYYSK